MGKASFCLHCNSAWPYFSSIMCVGCRSIFFVLPAPFCRSLHGRCRFGCLCTLYRTFRSATASNERISDAVFLCLRLVLSSIFCCSIPRLAPTVFRCSSAHSTFHSAIHHSAFINHLLICIRFHGGGFRNHPNG